ncbi:tetratricopeptide repeat protein [Hyunsoonleella pacifica]|uniref:Tetratricopeptide repeat protein n=1 Tax=Hyunsoonleella pacifica TaxID=1080224 RepID=A0A4Q9FPE7_9FLAO|nr:tetratricopeptide repeat protein [Hyunsoonleella pacifica]TBN16579.1 tetratricopeptide repeat protein [Hyunsoonleella pacifica]GGD18246.1 hypothetical protein GCM10011368_20200 [Hyunsoonleella pacifica]
MGLSIADAYYLKAKGASCGIFSDWDEVCEALNYALSYDENHCPSLCLLGEIYAEHLHMYDEAFNCFDKVIGIDPGNTEVYQMYAMYLIWRNKTERAEKLVKHALSIAEIGKAPLLWLLSCINETKGEYKVSLEHLKDAKVDSYNDRYFSYMQYEEKRIKKKIELSKPKAKKKKKKAKNKRKKSAK